MTVFKTLWRHFGVARVQVCRVDAQCRGAEQSVLAFSGKPHILCEGYYDVMQGLYRAVTFKLLLYDNTVYRVWVVFAWYVLYTTQSPPQGAKKVAIELPMYYWPIISQLLAELNSRRSSTDALACLQYQQNNGAFIYTLDWNIHAQNGRDLVNDVDIPALNPFFLKGAELCRGDVLSLAGMYEVNIADQENTMNSMQQPVPGSTRPGVYYDELRTLNASYPCFDTFTSECVGVQLPYCTVDVATGSIPPQSFLELLLQDPETLYAQPVLLHPQSVGIDVDYTYLDSSAVDQITSSYTGMTRNELSGRVISECKKRGLQDCISMYQHTVNSGQMNRTAMAGMPAYKEYGRILLNQPQRKVPRSEKQFLAPQVALRPPYTMSSDASALVQPVVSVPIAIESLVPDVESLERRLGMKIDGKLQELRRVSKAYLLSFLALTNISVDNARTKGWEMDDVMNRNEVNDASASETMEQLFGFPRLTDKDVIRTILNLSRGILPSTLAPSLQRIINFVETHSKDSVRVKDHLLELWRAQQGIGKLANEVEFVLDNLQRVLTDKRATATASNRLLGTVCKNSKVAGNGFDFQVLKTEKQFRDKHAAFMRNDRERKSKSRAMERCRLSAVVEEDNLFDSTDTEPEIQVSVLGASIPPIPGLHTLPTSGQFGGIPPMPGLDGNK